MRLILGILIVMLAGCATASKINDISVGMTKSEVIEAMGSPTSVSANEGVEYLNYSLYETREQAQFGYPTPYYVKLEDGKVRAYGRQGDFQSPKTKTINLNVKTSAETP